MIPTTDYHLHTPLCGHAEGQPREYAERAVSIGLKEIGFSDHAPLLSYRDPTITMGREQLPEYHRLIEEVREEFRGRLTIKIGIEADFLPGYEDQTRALLAQYPYDYVIGSVHFIDNWAFDNPDEVNGWNKHDIDDVYHRYYDHLRRSARSGLFDILGHVDLVKKFGHRAKNDMTAEIAETAAVFKESGVAIEINTSGLRKPVGEIYPALEPLKIYCRAGVPIVFGSDSHRPVDVGADFDQAVAWALQAGCRECLVYRQRRVEKRLPLQ